MKKLLVVAALASTFMATSAFAQSYIGFGVGSSRVSGVDGTEAGLTFTGGNTSKGSVKIYGGFKFTPTWGLEAQYSDLGRRNLTVTNGAGAVVGTVDTRASQYSLAGTGTLPIAQSFALIGKLGVSANRGSGGGSSSNKTSLMAGVGVSYSITPRLAARLEYEDFGKFADGLNGSSVRANNTSLNLQYAF